MKLLLLGTLSLALAETWIDQSTAEAAAANKACAAKDYTQCRQHLLVLEELLDGRADVVYRLAKVEAVLGNREAGLDRLTIFSKSGLTFADPSSEADFATLKETPAFNVILERLRSARQPVTHSRRFANLPEPDLIPEDIAYDPVRKRFYISSVRHSKILSMDLNGKFADFVPEGQPRVWSILALGVDAKRRVLWASTAAMPEGGSGYDPADDGRSALLKYSLDSGALLKRYDVKDDGKHVLGDMTLSAAGDVFVSDGYGAVYQVDHVRDALEILIGTGMFRSPQTPALTPDGNRLFVPDYSRGISVVDLKTKQAKLVEHPKELSLGGIDGLYLIGRTMLVTQNGTAPPRVIRMTLDPSLTHILQWETVEANWDGLGDPTHGVVVGKQFYFIANSGWNKLTDDGKLKPGASFESPTIQRLTIQSSRR